MTISTPDQRSQLWHNVKNRLAQLPGDTAYGMLLGISAALEVIEKHDACKAGAWLSQSASEHLDHAHQHIDYALGAGFDVNANAIDDDGLTHRAHAAARAILGNARAEMEKGGQ